MAIANERVARRKIGIEQTAEGEIGRDPRQMTTAELGELGHQTMSPLAALRARCIDCCSGSRAEVRACVAVECPSWPFRMGKNPWRAPLDPEEAKRRGDRMRERFAAAGTPINSQGADDDEAS